MALLSPAAFRDPQLMRRMAAEELYRCDLCHRSVDEDTRERARGVPGRR